MSDPGSESNTHPDTSVWRDRMNQFHRQMLAEWDTATESHTFEYQKVGVDIEDELNKTKGTWIDLGGPSPGLDCFGVDLRRPLISANIRINPYIKSDLKTDVLIDDVKTLPFASGSLGGVFMNGFPPIKLNAVSQEIWRIIEPGGLWYISTAFGQDIENIEKLGFEVLKLINVDDTEPGNKFMVLLQKTI